MDEIRFDRRLYRNPPPASLERGVLRAYLDALYRVDGEDLALELRIGLPHDGLRRFFESRRVSSLVGITAYNPGGLRRDAKENREAQERLRARLKAGGWAPLLEGSNLEPAGLWPLEPSLWAAGMGLEEGVVLGGDFGQDAIVAISSDGIPKLAFCLSERI